ncbi:MAG: PEP-CTERM sorting domain-containing protein [Verrucomicrobiota bacterium]
MKTNLIKLTCGLALLGAATPVPAQSLFDVQFNTSGHQQTGAAVIGQSGDYWNLLTTKSGTSSLMDSQDASSGVSFTWASQGLEGSGVYPDGFSGGSYASLMGGYVFEIGSQTMSFANLPADASYTLYIYTQGDYASDDRETSVTVSGTTYTTAPTDGAANTFIAGQNYLEITGMTDGSGNLQFTYQAAVDEADINGIQLSINPVPEPSTLALAGLGGLSLLLFRRRK